MPVLVVIDDRCRLAQPADAVRSCLTPTVPAPAFKRSGRGGGAGNKAIVAHTAAVCENSGGISYVVVLTVLEHRRIADRKPIHGIRNRCHDHAFLAPRPASVLGVPIGKPIRFVAVARGSKPCLTYVAMHHDTGSVAVPPALALPGHIDVLSLILQDESEMLIHVGVPFFLPSFVLKFKAAFAPQSAGHAPAENRPARHGRLITAAGAFPAPLSPAGIPAPAICRSPRRFPSAFCPDRSAGE